MIALLTLLAFVAAGCGVSKDPVIGGWAMTGRMSKWGTSMVNDPEQVWRSGDSLTALEFSPDGKCIVGNTLVSNWKRLDANRISINVLMDTVYECHVNGNTLTLEDTACKRTYRRTGS